MSRDQKKEKSTESKAFSKRSEASTAGSTASAAASAASSDRNYNSWKERKSGDFSVLKLNEREQINPFAANQKGMSQAELTLRIIHTFFLLPIRMLAIGVCVICLLWPWSLMLMIGQDMSQPLTGWRRRFILVVARFVMRLAYFFAGVVWIDVKGERASPEEAPIYVAAPHTSFFDPVLVCVLSGVPSIVTKSDALGIPFVGKITAANQPVWIDRFDPNARSKVVEEIKGRARSGGTWWQLLIFPEGTTSSGRSLITFKAGAFLPGVPVQPVIIKLPSYMIWTWDSPSALYIIWRVLTTLWTPASVEFLPVYRPSIIEKNDASLFADNVRRSMAEHMGVGVTDACFEDCRVIQAAQSFGLPIDVGAIGVTNVSKLLDVSTEQILQELRHFAKEGQKHPEGCISLTGFGDLIRLPVDSPSSNGWCAEAFALFEKENKGLMTFREYLTFIVLAKLGDEGNVFKTAEFYGDDEEPFSYEQLLVVTKIVLLKRGVAPEEIDAAAERLKQRLKDWKQQESSDETLLELCETDPQLGEIFG